MEKSKLSEVKKLLNMKDKDDVAIVTITPELASELLKYNTHNRNKQKRRVNEYAADMAIGKFTLSESVIGFDRMGVLTNGQTRLQASVKSGGTFESIVCTRLEQNAHIDTGNTRNIIDNIQLTGAADGYINVNANSLKAVIEVIRQSNNSQRVGVESTVDFCRKYGKFVDKAYHNGLFVMQKVDSGLGRSQIAAALLAATMNGVSDQTLIRVRSILTTGMAINESDAIIIKWRTQIIKMCAGKCGMGTTFCRQLYLATQHVIYCVENGKKTTAISWNKEYYPTI